MGEVKNLTEQYNKMQASKILACYGVVENNNINKSKESTELSESPKFKKVMDEWKAGTLTSSSGEKVTDQKQALAIAFSEAKKVEKSEEGDLEKGGEGSRGGKVIGHTKSGKPIYDSFEHEGHKNFTTEDHKDAAEQNFHHKYENYNNHNTQEQFKHHSRQSILHDKKYWDMKAKDMLKDLDGKVEKSEKNDLEKGGVGSGRKVGTTSSGKDIYDNHAHESHKNFNEKEHEEAADYHKKEILKHRDSQKENDKKIDSLNRDEIFSKKHKELEDKDKEISDKIKHHESNYYGHIDSANKQYKNK